MKKPKLNIVTLGCSKNKVDSERLAASLEFKYDIMHDSDKKSDVVIINTCGFIGDAKEESIDTILEYAELRRAKKIKRLYVTGCLSQRYRKDLQEEIHEVDGFYGVESVQMIAKDILTQESADSETLRLCDSVSYNHERVLSTPEHYAYLKISEGCNRRCAFCAIPLIRGEHVSVPMDDLIKEAELLAQKGVKELILIAQDLTYYGRDIDGQYRIVELVKRLLEIKEFEWIRLHYGYPQGFPDELLDLMNQEPRICNYIDLPLQHISTPILKNMRRGVDKEQTINFVKNARNRVPGIAFRTTFIVGFPGETEEQFEELCDFIREMKFERAGVFAYSPEEGTPAYEMEDDVPEEVKQQRVDDIMAIQQNISLETNEKRVGTVEKVLIDRVEGDYYVGRTQYDSPEVDDEILISLDDADLEVGTFVNAKIVKADYFDLYAEIV
ncbi:MAG: 30S ribosomal protein S12 methylthiotransferase RimO [Bacteroidales bacterium]|nr:30S ribosomal protein S12 methylthiotransferase RimO [Bacteroidales bacterium]MBO5853511.1 30S ribosomal protein S12 methylthiotransferase RimO [Bacteroidales bacterium]